MLVVPLLLWSTYVGGGGEGALGLVLEMGLKQGLAYQPGKLVPQATSLHLAPGYQVLKIVRVHLGVAAGLDALQDGELRLELCPSVVVSPPILPVYARMTAGVVDILGKATFALGGALGGEWHFGDVGLFAEVGALPRRDHESAKRPVLWVVEASGGLSVTL